MSQTLTANKKNPSKSFDSEGLVPEAVETLNLLQALKDIYDTIESMPEIMAEFENLK